MLLHVYGNTAYRSEMALFRAHGVTATEAEPVSVDDSACALYLVEHDEGAPGFYTDGIAALEAFRRRGGVRLAQLAVV